MASKAPCEEGRCTTKVFLGVIGAFMLANAATIGYSAFWVVDKVSRLDEQMMATREDVKELKSVIKHETIAFEFGTGAATKN